MLKDTIKLINKPSKRLQHAQSNFIDSLRTIILFSEQLFTLFEPVIGPSSIVYANGQEWKDRKQWIYDSLKGKILESYIPTFIKVIVWCTVYWLLFIGSNLVCCKVKNIIVLFMSNNNAV